ncbi:MAG: c-type cytochrome [Thermomicrobiales bacterium]
MRGNGRRRGYMLMSIMLLAVVAVACGRATENDINSALGITPTATLSPDQQSTATAEAAARATDIALGIAPSPGSLDDVDLASLGNLTLGRTAFAVQCQRCHTPSGQGAAAALSGANNPAAALSDSAIYAMISDGTNHGKDIGGPGALTTLSDAQIYNIIAFLRGQP